MDHAAGGTVNVLADATSSVWDWLGDSSQRTYTHSIPHNLWLTAEHALSASALAIVIAIPLAVVLAHFRKAETVSTWVVNLGRVIPTVTILAIFVVASLRNGFGFAPWPIIFALTLLALPPMFANTYTAIREVPADAVAAARSMGFTEAQVMRRVEMPLGLPVILAGVRVAVTQVVATEALGALFGSEGLGIYISSGTSVSDLHQIQAGALLVAGAALVADLSLALAGHLAVPRGVRPVGRAGRTAPHRHGMRRATDPPTTTTPSLGGTT